MRGLDRLTREFWHATGRPVDLAGAEQWLDAPMNHGATVGDAWLESAADAVGGAVRDEAHAGLLADLGRLDGPGFDAGGVHPAVRHFYEHTADWRMEVWTQWNPLFQPGGEVISRFFGRRVQQLALPTRPLDVAHGMDSRVATIVDATGAQRAAGWIRTLRSTGEYVFSGCYSHRTLPGAARASVHVAFPLESGNVQVFLRPSVLPGGGLELASPPGAWGEDGAYVVVRDSGRTHARRVPLHEVFRMYVDGEGVVRCDHRLALWSATVVRLHYRLEPKPTGADKGTTP